MRLNMLPHRFTAPGSELGGNGSSGLWNRHCRKIALTETFDDLNLFSPSEFDETAGVGSKFKLQIFSVAGKRFAAPEV